MTFVEAIQESSQKIKDWIQKNFINKSNVDSTLTQEGQAADAKAVGDALSNVSGGKDGVSPTVQISEITDGHSVAITDVNGSQTFNVLDGEDGVGIESFEQTTTSTEDNGENIITVTLTDGTVETFVVHNGSKGSTGEAGYTPVKGIDYFTEADKTEIVDSVLSNFTDVSEVGM